MTRSIVSIEPACSLKKAAQTMLDHGVSGLPVVDAEGTMVGIVSEADFVRKEAETDRSGRYRLLEPIFGSGESALVEAATVAEIMTSHIVSVRPDQPVAAAARLMVDGVKRLPVLDERGVLVGVISRADVLRVFARNDEELVAEIEDLLAGGLLPIDPDAIAVAASDGVIVLRGEIDSRRDALILAELVARIDGVTNVDSRLRWEVDDRLPAQRFPGYSQEGANE